MRISEIPDNFTKNWVEDPFFRSRSRKENIFEENFLTFESVLLTSV